MGQKRYKVYSPRNSFTLEIGCFPQLLCWWWWFTHPNYKSLIIDDELIMMCLGDYKWWTTLPPSTIAEKASSVPQSPVDMRRWNLILVPFLVLIIWWLVMSLCVCWKASRCQADPKGPKLWAKGLPAKIWGWGCRTQFCDQFCRQQQSGLKSFF